jgi:hypothetical protein
MDDKEVKKIFYGKYNKNNIFREIPYEEISKKITNNKNTIKKLYKDYYNEAQKNNQKAYSISHFYRNISESLGVENVTMRLNHKLGESCQSDWLGDKYLIKNTNIKIHVFICVCSFSKYIYAEGFLNEKEESWILGHIHAYTSFNGTPRITICDNLLAGVYKSDKYDPTANLQFLKMAEYYNTAICPTRLRKPKDKGIVENAVGITTKIIRNLSDEDIKTLNEFNEILINEINILNKNNFQNGKKSRYELLQEEISEFNKLPINQYQIVEIKKAKVQKNYHVQIKKMLYSVPYIYAGKIIFYEINDNKITISYDNKTIATHDILIGEPGQFSTKKEHMHPRHINYEFISDPEKLLNIAESIGINTYTIITKVIDRYKVPE